MKNGNSYQEQRCARWGVLGTKKVLGKRGMKETRVKSTLRSIEMGGKEC